MWAGVGIAPANDYGENGYKRKMFCQGGMATINAFTKQLLKRTLDMVCKEATLSNKYWPITLAICCGM